MTDRKRFRKIVALVGLGCLLAGAGGAQQENPRVQRQWTPAEMEQFLLEAEIVTTREIPEGVTGTLRATLRHENFVHDAQIQHVDVAKPNYPTSNGYESNFRDSYRYNIAAYSLDRLLQLDMIPVSVERILQGRPSAVTWWVDDILMTEKNRYVNKIQPPSRARWNQQMHIVRVFDELIYNVDRNLGNLLIAKDWKIWMIDHTRSFRLHKRLRRPQNLLKCDRRLLQTLRTLTEEEVSREVGPSLLKPEVEALMARRDEIVKLFDQKIASEGEGAILYNLLANRNQQGRTPRSIHAQE